MVYAEKYPVSDSSAYKNALLMREMGREVQEALSECGEQKSMAESTVILFTIFALYILMENN